MGFLATFFAGRAWAIVKALWPLWAALAVVGAIWFYGHRQYNAGYADATAALTPVIKQTEKARDDAVAANRELSAAMVSIKALYLEQTQAVNTLMTESQRAQSRATAAQLALAQRERALTMRIAELQVQIETPAATPQEACDEAGRILTDMATHRAEAP